MFLHVFQHFYEFLGVVKIIETQNNATRAMLSTTQCNIMQNALHCESAKIALHLRGSKPKELAKLMDCDQYGEGSITQRICGVL